MAKRQFAALPFSAEGDAVKILLVTTRRRGRWSVPKGWPIPDRKPHQTAGVEAYEEAGLVGKRTRRLSAGTSTGRGKASKTPKKLRSTPLLFVSENDAGPSVMSGRLLGFRQRTQRNWSTESHSGDHSAVRAEPPRPTLQPWTSCRRERS